MEGRERKVGNALKQSLINKEQIALSRGHYLLQYRSPLFQHELFCIFVSLALKMSRLDGRRVRYACGQSSLKDPRRTS